MSKKLKISTLCELKKSEIEKHLDEIIGKVSTPEFICLKCARVSKSAKHLCKSHKILSEK